VWRPANLRVFSSVQNLIEKEFQFQNFDAMKFTTPHVLC